jgi:uncharacterized membrane protein
MTQIKQTATKKTKTTPKVAAVKTSKKQTEVEMCDCSKEKKALIAAEDQIATMTLAEDFRNSVLIVSLLVNMFILIAWITMQVTTKYDYAVSALIFGR